MTIITRTNPYQTVLHGRGHPPIDVEVSGERADWQRMWLRTKTTAWQTLALVPGDDRASTFEVATLIARLAYDHGERVRVADVRGLAATQVEAFLAGARWETDQGTRLVFATRSVSDNLATISLARAADCAILCVSLGSTSLASVKDTVEQVGRKHFLGSLLVKAAAERPPSTQATLRRAPGRKARP
jgi:hypothetical protein